MCAGKVSDCFGLEKPDRSAFPGQQFSVISCGNPGVVVHQGYRKNRSFAYLSPYSCCSSRMIPRITDNMCSGGMPLVTKESAPDSIALVRKSEYIVKSRTFV